MMRDGRIVQIGTGEDILNDPATDYVAQFVRDVDRTRVLTAGAVMTPPVALVGSEQGPRAVYKLMREHQTARLFVVDRNKTLCGAVDEEAIVAAVRDGAETLDGILDDRVVSVSEHAHLSGLLALSADTPKALAVVDDERRVVGVLARVTLLRALGPTGASAHVDGAEPSEAPAPAPDHAPSEVTTP
jgi:glycine betaine/proline transport system ATP-binding protein